VGEVPAVKIEVSQSLFIQVLNNLIRNAVNASPEQGTVDLTVRVVDRDVVFSVVDDGPGVAEVIADTLFEPFATNSVNGTGLGLTISAHIMQLLGGRIQYRKHPERGAAFSVMLPVAA
jgi:signal transduction histidine kinase